MKRLIRETEKPSFPAQCRVLAEAAVLWALLAAGAQLLLPAEKTALPEGAALAWAALRICLVTPLAEELADRKSTRLNSSHSRKSRMPSSA